MRAFAAKPFCHLQDTDRKEKRVTVSWANCCAHKSVSSRLAEIFCTLLLVGWGEVWGQFLVVEQRKLVVGLQHKLKSNGFT